ncbi:inositol polyphosphate-5-phosphatase A-like isoform X2 [Hypanus sabinus]|uniref:inositol polyphosphate-5-phosphatase A-like isoform X2 n=1 Tax=Hypanus sabinus TaxID=79690 RepID=UPI0028C4542A|nr:inositol polyphosphate-5-phosphatase A-like isoform X2 [Hypanus sabinus]
MDALLLTANVGSLFDDLEGLQSIWLQEFYQTVAKYRPRFIAIHLQEIGGKDYETGMVHVDAFVHGILSSEEMRQYDRVRVYLDEHFSAPSRFTFKWSRKGYIRTRWRFQDHVFDLVNIHLFHDASNLVAWKYPSIFSANRQKALGHVLNRITDSRYEKAPFLIFGDFNVRLDTQGVVETLCCPSAVQTVLTNDAEDVKKVLFQEKDNDHKVLLRIESKTFDYFDQDVFRENNGKALLKFDKELATFIDEICELDIQFPPSYPYSEVNTEGTLYANTRCPAWCDRILMSPSAIEVVIKGEYVYDMMGPEVCMGDHKPVYLYFQICM